MKKLYYGLNKVSNAICKVLSILIVAVVMVNAGSVLLQVLNRYVIVKVSDLSFPWTEELARYSMIWLCYLALPIVYREGAMAQLDIIFDRLGKRNKTILYVLTRILCFIFIGVAVYFGVHIVQTRMMFHSSMLHAPGYVLYSAPIFGCTLMAFEILTEMIGVFAGVLEPFYGGNDRQYPECKKGEETE